MHVGERAVSTLTPAARESGGGRRRAGVPQGQGDGSRLRPSRTLGAGTATMVAVGTALAGGPPHRSQRAGLPHWAPTLGVWR